MLTETIAKELHEVFADSFMKPQIEESDYFECETEQGTSFVPADLVRLPFAVNFKAGGFFDDESPHWRALARSLLPYVNGDELAQVTVGHGFMARLSAPGYMDCTDWTAYETADQAAQSLISAYGDN